MAVAAVPEYVGNHFDDAPPGHRFGLYFAMWDAGSWQRASKDVAKLEALRSVCSYPTDAIDLTKQLRDRQQAAADTLEDHALTLHAKATAPFLTGIGMEHPLENGFAFLNPYGLPYLPGASIKGVLRSAAEELALGLWDDSQGWDMLAVWRLFGLETGASYLTGPARGAPDTLRDLGEERRMAYLDWVEGEAWVRQEQEVEGLISLLLPRGKELDQWLDHPGGFLRALTGAEVGGRRLETNNLHLKGALAFWDAIIAPPDGKLEIDILNPHHGGYYQNGTPPHDAESPIPNYFLTVPPKSRLRFHVALAEPAALPARLTTGWRALIEAAFTHAFEWLGFGAKTAVGYGQMARDPDAEREAKELAVEHQQEAEIAALSQEERDLRELRGWLEDDKNNGIKDAGGRLPNRLGELFNQADGWPQPAREQLADLAEAIYGYLGWGKKQKPEERRARIQALRGGA
jgi:CRISPR-associated protein Cmr6